MKLYVVGGTLRDMLLGRAPRDPDIAFSGSVEEFLQAYPDARKINASFPVFGVRRGEYARLRAGSIEEDLLARDFTINALAMDEKGRLFSHPKSFSDLKSGIIRPCGPNSLELDPGRVFRAARFAAEFPTFTLAPSLLEQLQAIGAAKTLGLLPAERVAGEFLKALETPRPGRFFKVLLQGNCLSPWFKELERAAALPAGPRPWHTGSVFEHITDTMNNAARHAPKAIKRPATYMAFIHDIGKVLSDPAKLPAHHGHDRKGEDLAVTVATRLRLPGRFKSMGKAAARWHMTASQYTSLRPGTKVELLMDLHRLDILRPFFAMVRADASRRGRNVPDLTPMAEHDLECILTVHLPKHLRDQGESSAIHLKALRAQALAERDRKYKASAGKNTSLPASKAS